MIFPAYLIEQPRVATDALAALQALVGDWVGEGAGQPGEATGGCTFRMDLDGKVFVRNNWANYPATKDRPAFRHDDLMVGSVTPQGVKSVYWDNEGHRIDYAVSAPEPGVVVFLSEAQSGAPRFRMTYRVVTKDALTLTFEIAPPGQPEAFKPYIQAKLRRK